MDRGVFKGIRLMEIRRGDARSDSGAAREKRAKNKGKRKIELGCAR